MSASTIIDLVLAGSTQWTQPPIGFSPVQGWSWLTCVHLEWQRSRVMLLYRGPGADEYTDEHEGWVAGRWPDGSLTDIWTDVRGYAELAFSAYLPRCECGWIGTAVPATTGGYQGAQWQWRSRHLPGIVAGRPTRRRLPEPLCVQGSFVPER